MSNRQQNTEPIVVTEEDLIAFQMGECSRLRSWQIRRALERDPALAEEAAQIAATLRAFSDTPAPATDANMLDRIWSAVRPSMPVLEPRPKASDAWRLWAAGLAGSVAGAVLVLMLISHVRLVHDGEQNAHNHPLIAAPTTGGQPLQNASVNASVKDAQVAIAGLEGGEAPPAAKEHAAFYHGRPGPITQTREDIIATETGLAAHLDASQRLLTEVSNEDGPLPLVTRREVHRLLLENAVYQQRARGEGDFAAAEVMDHLGRALTSLDADPPKSAANVDAFRLEFNVGGVMFDLRVLADDRSSTPKETAR